MRKYFAVLAAQLLTYGTAGANIKVLTKLRRYTQERSNWCQMACSQTVMDFYDRNYADQCEFRSFNDISGTRCCQSDEYNPSCNVGWPWNQDGYAGFSFLVNWANIGISMIHRAQGWNFSAMKAEIDNSRPFFIICQPASGPTGHVMVGSGYNDGVTPKYIQLIDPSTGGGVRWVKEDGNTKDACIAVNRGDWYYSVKTGGYPPPASDIIHLYADPYFGGTHLATGTTPYVGDAINDRTSSIKQWGLPAAFYVDANYSGAAMGLLPMGNTLTSLAAPFDDVISSVKQFPTDGKVGVYLFENQNYGGQQMLLSGSWGDMHGSWGDRVSSVYVVDGIWQAFTDINFGGLPYLLTATGGPSHNGFYPNPASWGGPDEDISSIQLVWSRHSSETAPILLYDDFYMEGRGVALTSTSPSAWLNNFSSFGFNDKVSSIKTFPNSKWDAYTDANQGGTRYQLAINRWYGDWTRWGGNNDEISSVRFVGATGGWGF
jgi:hypothetical protein